MLRTSGFVDMFARNCQECEAKRRLSVAMSNDVIVIAVAATTSAAVEYSAESQRRKSCRGSERRRRDRCRGISATAPVGLLSSQA